MCYESKQNKYRPEQIKILFVGESRPAQGTYFYLANSNLFNGFRRVFDQELCTGHLNDEDFLTRLQQQGMFLDDLCNKPVNQVASSTRRQKNEESIPSLARRIQQYAPQAIVAVLKSIDEYVLQAIAQSGINYEQIYYAAVPFCGNGQQSNFVREMTKVIKELIRLGFIDPDAFKK